MRDVSTQYIMTHDVVAKNRRVTSATVSSVVVAVLLVKSSVVVEGDVSDRQRCVRYDVGAD